MKYQDYERMKLLADEVRRGNIYKDKTGFYNFQMLEGLLRKHDLMTPEYQRTLSELRRKRMGVEPTFDDILDDVMWVLPLAMAISGETEEQLIERARQHFQEKLDWDNFFSDDLFPPYENVENWYTWGNLLKSRKDSTPIQLSDGWKIKYLPQFGGTQILKDSDGQFISILGPRLRYGSRPEPTFEFCVGVEASGPYISYSEVRQELTTKFLIEPPSESALERTIMANVPTH